ncbi:threonine-phosphate decarboxylase [Sphingomonas sp.]|uniref:threonine-phosphate decarboxylase n=1 Tax=Sphingomonas sp. TaxID=28214 RepID=UPI002ED7B431
MSAWTWHGGQLAQARAAFGDTAEPWIDLSTGINPHAWPGVGELAIDWARLPDPGALADLEAIAAACFGADPACVLALPGSEIGLRLLGERLPGPVRHVRPGYRTHGEMVPDAVPVASGAVNPAEGTLIVANPNNPDGRLIPAATLRAQMARGWLVLDEAFADADPRHSLAGEVGAGRRLIVLRSFGKFFGLAGVRLGFLIAPPALAAELRARIGAWPVSAAAIAIGSAAYRDAAWIAAMRIRLTEAAAALDQLLEARGYTVTGACPLFRLIETDDAHRLFECLARRSILTRPFDYDRRWLRIGLPRDADALARLGAALADA